MHVHSKLLIGARTTKTLLVICHAILYSSFNYYSYLTQTKLYNSFPAELFSKSKVSSSKIQFFPAQILIYFGLVVVIFSSVYINSEISEAFRLHVDNNDLRNAWCYKHAESRDNGHSHDVV